MKTNDLDLGGVTARCVSAGPAPSASSDAALPLLLLHGFTGSSLDWYDVIPPLARRRRVIAFDHRGHGDSAKYGLESAYTFDALLGDLVRVVDTLGLDRFHLLGHSMGGVIAMRYALLAPGRLASLVLVDTAAAPTGQLPTEVLDSLVATGRSAGMDAVAELILGWLPDATEVQRERGRRKWSSFDIEAMAGFASELGSYPDLLPELALLTLPTKVICGADDDLLPACRLLADTILGADLDVIAGAGHSPFEDAQHVWVDIVQRHLAQVEAGSTA